MLNVSEKQVKCIQSKTILENLPQIQQLIVWHIVNCQQTAHDSSSKLFKLFTFSGEVPYEITEPNHTDPSRTVGYSGRTTRSEQKESLNFAIEAPSCLITDGFQRMIIPCLRSQTEIWYAQTVPDGKCLCPDFRAFTRPFVRL